MSYSFNCIFCKLLISCDGKDLTRFNSHVELEHGVYFKVQLVMCLNFMSEEEVVELTDRLEPRLKEYLDSGEIVKDQNIFQVATKPCIPRSPHDILKRKLEGTTVSKYSRRPPPGPPNESKEAKRLRMGESENTEEMLLVEEPGDKEAIDIEEEEIELSEDDMEEDDNDTDNGRENLKRRLILMNLKSMIVNASAEAKEQTNFSENSKESNSVGGEKSVQCKLCFSSLSRSNLGRHEKRYHKDHMHLKEGYSDSHYQCDFCEVKLQTEGLYGVHFIKNHAKESFTCKGCSLKIEGTNKIERIEYHLHACNTIKLKRDDTLKPCRVQLEKVPISDNFEYLREKWKMTGNGGDQEEVDIILEKQGSATEANVDSDSEKDVICRLCYTKLSSPTNLKRHEQTVHQDDQAALALTSFTKQDLIHHCDMCPLQFLTENLLNTHKKMQHRINVKTTSIECKICHKVVTTKSLKGHMQTHEELERNFECKLCYLKFKHQKSLSSHYSHVHKNDEMLNKEITEADLKYPCTVCELRFVSEEFLKGHLRRHENNKYEFLRNESFNEDLQMFKCKLCYKDFKEYHKMKDHIVVNHKEDLGAVFRTITEEELSYPCEKCSSKFLSKSILNYHLYRAHNEMNVMRPIVQSASQPSSKQLFQTSRLDCKLCYTKFVKSEMLKAHEESVHKFDTELLNREIGEEELRYSCYNCDLHFVTENIMLMHRRISFCDLNKS